MTDRFYSAADAQRDREANAITVIKDLARKLEEAFDHGEPIEEGKGYSFPVPKSRAKSLALARLEESIMWIEKHWEKLIVDHEAQMKEINTRMAIESAVRTAMQ